MPRDARIGHVTSETGHVFLVASKVIIGAATISILIEMGCLVLANCTRRSKGIGKC